MNKIPCKTCGTFILESTSLKNNGNCMLCKRGITKEICENCHKESDVLSEINGKRICLSCNIKISNQKLDSMSENNSNHKRFDVTTLKIKPFPDHQEVFTSEDTCGLFFPLCSFKIVDTQSNNQQCFHIVSHNGIWLDDTHSDLHLNSDYFKFNIIEDKYEFKGHIEAFNGYRFIKDILPFLDKDFEKNKTSYINLDSEQYISSQLSKYTQVPENFDFEYYLNNYFSYHKNKMKYIDRVVINDFQKIESFVNDYYINLSTDSDFTNLIGEIILNQDYLQFPVDLETMIPTAVCYNSSYFEDGNDTFLFLNEEFTTAYCINHYS